MLFHGCTTDETLCSGEGSLSLSMDMLDKTVSVSSRALPPEEETKLGNGCKIRIYKGDALIKKYKGISSVPEQIPLPSGDYKIRVTAGDSVAASFDKKFFEGVEEFKITNGHVTELNVTCHVRNTVVRVIWDESLKEVFKDDYQVTVSSPKGKLVFKAKEDKKGYFSLPADNDTLNLEFKAKKKSDGKEFVKKNRMIRCNPSTLYNLTYKFQSGPSNVGGGLVDIKVDESSLGTSDTTIVLIQRPLVSLKDKDGKEIDLAKDHTVPVGSKDPYTLTVGTSSPITSFVMKNDKFTELGMSSNELDMMTFVNVGGIELIKDNPDDLQEGNFWQVKFSSDLIGKMTGAEGEYTTTITVSDKNGKSRETVWKFVVSNTTVETAPLKDYSVWTNKATLLANVVTEPKGKVAFRYRVKEKTDWQNTVDAVKGENSYYAEIAGLTPATTYEYQVMDGETVSNVTCEFTTDSEFQPENSSFEDESGDCPLLIYGEGQSMWWDTGNHGSATLGKNVTTTDKSIKHGDKGTKSILLTSQRVEFWGIGKFAAGNLFAGKYLETEGTDGILGWGRPCTSRPTKMKLWVKYLPSNSGKEGSHQGLDGEDKGTIYVAVGDWDGQKYGGETWPFIVKTKDAASLFSTEKGTYSGDGIIGYGGKVLEGKYEGEKGELKLLEIPINYEDYGGYNRKPTHIIIVASASLYGDYFTGYEGSKMWIDDVELVYE